MNSFQRNALFVGILLFVLAAVGGFGYHLYQAHEAEAAEQKVAWKKENIRRLKDLSQIGALSTEEQTRLDAAGDDVDRIQQVLLDLHTERHTFWEADLMDVEDKERKLRNVGALVTVFDGGELREAAESLDRERIRDEANLQGFEQGERDIRAWKPISFEEFQAEQRNGTVDREPTGPTMAKPSAQISTANDQEPVVAPIPASPPPSPAAAEPAPVEAGDGIDPNIRNAFNEWVDAERSNDPQRIAACYAQHVDRYYLQTNLNHEQLADYLVQEHQHGTSLLSLGVNNLAFTNLADGHVSVTFIESYDFQRDTGESTGKVNTTLHFLLEGGTWKVDYERQVKL